MAPARKSKSRKYAVRMKKLRAIRKEKREEAQKLETRKQATILLRDWSRQGIVGNRE